MSTSLPSWRRPDWKSIFNTPSTRLSKRKTLQRLLTGYFPTGKQPFTDTNMIQI